MSFYINDILKISKIFAQIGMEKWSQFRRRYFRMHFAETKLLYFESYFMDSWGPTNQHYFR